MIIQFHPYNNNDVTDFFFVKFDEITDKLRVGMSEIY